MSPNPAYVHVPTHTRQVGDTVFAYRDLGPRTGVPVILLNHLAAVLDGWDPRVVDGLAAKHRVITVDYRGLGASTGDARTSVEDIARDMRAFIHALGLTEVDILGLSLGGFVTQAILLQEPQLVRRAILAGTGPAGGPGITSVTRISILATIRAAFARTDPRKYMFFPASPAGRQAADAFLLRVAERQAGLDDPPKVPAFLNQLKAIKAWGQAAPDNLSVVEQRVLVVNGDNDTVVPTLNTQDLARRFPKSELVIYPDAGHGAIFQYHRAFVETALRFLA